MIQYTTQIEELLTVSLVVLIWLVQIVHYPLFEFISDDEFPASMEFHQQRISYIAFPLMVLELIISFYHAALRMPGSFIILIIVGLIWISTGLIQVPLHKKLTEGKDIKAINQLVKSNWIRTVLWSLKALIVFSGT